MAIGQVLQVVMYVFRRCLHFGRHDLIAIFKLDLH